MRKRTVCYIFSGLVVLLIIAAVVVTLVLVLKNDDKNDSSSTSSTTIPITTTTTTLISTTTAPSIDDQISLNSTFPNGSSIVDVSELGAGSVAYSPLEVTIADLNSIGINVDNSSLVAETGRQSFFYIRLPPPPPPPTIADRKKRAINDDEIQSNIGIRFGNSSIINVVPLSLISQFDSGLSVVGSLPDSSTIYLLKIRMAESMCAGATSGACSVISWKPYSISDSNVGSPGQFNTALPVACGSQCDVASSSPCSTSSCTTCDGQTVAGEDTPVTRRYKMGKKSGNLTFTYETYTVKDRIKVTYEDQMLFDSGCVGTEGEKSAPISFSGTTDELRVDVEPNCDGTTGTEWYFTLPCLELSCSAFKDISPVQLFSGADEVLSGSIVYITDEPKMPDLMAYYCKGQNPTATVQFNFTLEFDYIVCLKSAGNFVCANPFPRKCIKKLPGSTISWDIGQAFGSTIQGGNATLDWQDSEGQSGKINFQILGKNPTSSTVISLINQNSPPWYAMYIAAQESAYQQFNSSTWLPKMSGDFGYGIYQITNPQPTCDDVWNWKSSVATGKKVIQDKIKIASTWMTKQRGQALADTGKAVPIPCHQVLNCVFQENTGKSIDDAVAMKAFNGAKDHYVAWNNAEKCWYFVELNEQEKNYVQDVCRHVPSNSDSCPNPDPYANNLCPST